MSKRKSKRVATGKRKSGCASVNGYDSQLGCARGELMLVEYAANKAVKELRKVADRIERMAECTRDAYERINPNRES